MSNVIPNKHININIKIFECLISTSQHRVTEINICMFKYTKKASTSKASQERTAHDRVAKSRILYYTYSHILKIWKKIIWCGEIIETYAPTAWKTGPIHWRWLFCKYYYLFKVLIQKKIMRQQYQRVIESLKIPSMNLIF